MTDREFENFYREHLEEDIVICLANRRKIPFEQAMNLYYTSATSDLIHQGKYGIQYLDYTILTDFLEKELAAKSEVRSKK